jgi:hypothetical protein
VKLCMFTPVELDLERGWPGKIDGERVLQVAAQTLQAFFTGGGTAREHAEYPLGGVRLLAPVLRPPSIRIFETPGRFEFANPAAVLGLDAVVPPLGALEVHARVAAVIGDAPAIGGFTILAEVRAPELPAPKDRDFALILGPVVVTPDELTPRDFDWDAAVQLAGRNTALYPGDVLAAPAHEILHPGEAVEVEVDGIGVLRNPIV